MKLLLSIFSLLLLTNSCNTSKNAMNAKTLDQNSISGDYLVTQIENKATKDLALKITFDANSNKVTGFAGCNSFFGTYTLDNNKINFSDMASSKKYCGKEIGDVEQNFLTLLRKANKIELRDNKLVLYTDDVSVLNADKIEVSKLNTTNNPKKDLVKENYSKTLVTYKVLSRSKFDYIQISKSEIVTSKDRNLKTMNSYPCKAEDWEALNKILNEVDVEHLDQLEAPTDKRLYDGAAHATLSVIKGDVEMMSPTFDHGMPPKEIEALVNKVLSISENTSKQ
ncbi:META domain-containing protein [Winogradskyella sp.]|uniref:META domain-containing protein n=1 Tax=Winogradskyella sp. TaxID=1883156 RepID=UPI002617BA44|nr:META domain-containing protein [Winogradskyella sp.]